MNISPIMDEIDNLFEIQDQQALTAIFDKLDGVRNYCDKKIIRLLNPTTKPNKINQ